ncbi:CidA/LrgA family protein [Selenomonas sp. TAMA-11512]|uniref:CidA/LrgA family protein n=1 Tax=Selenomonas sp. TAMA-11512 TaxID=3095337 RepID=UPI0030859300|nr:CidA/LrgA family protein [Selenomonas sp. TAMA-11512]
MKYLREFAIILGITCIGEIIKYLIPLPIPASVYGLIIMLSLLSSGRLRLNQVQVTGRILIETMPLMFIPAGVGLMFYWDELQPVIVPVLVITFITTIVVSVSTGKMSDALLTWKNRGKHGRHHH